MQQVAMFLGVNNIFSVAEFIFWFRELELDTGGIYALVASIVINIAAWNIGIKVFSDLAADLLAQYVFFWLNWFYIPVRALCHLYFIYEFYWKRVRQIQEVAVQNMQLNMYSSTLVIIGSVVGSILVPYFIIYIGISYLPLLVWRIFFDSDLGYNLQGGNTTPDIFQRLSWMFFSGLGYTPPDALNLFAWLSWIFFSGDTPPAAHKLFAWLSWVSHTAYYTLFIDIPALDYVKMNLFKFAFYAACAFGPLVVLALFAFLHRKILGNASDSLQPYYIMIKYKMPLLFAQFGYPFDTWPTRGWTGVAIITFVLLSYKFCKNNF